MIPTQQLTFRTGITHTIYGKAMLVENNDIHWGALPSKDIGGPYGTVYFHGAYVLACSGYDVHAFPKGAFLRARKFYKPGGEPVYVRCYDNGGRSFDRYTVVYSGRYRKVVRGYARDEFQYVGMSECPFNPQGFGQHGSSPQLIDRPTYGHLGKKIKFSDLPADCQRLVLQDYKEIWNI